MIDKFELTILSNLIHNEEFARKAIPFLKEDFFKDRIETIVFQQINNFVVKYNNLPTKEALTIELSNLKNITEEEFKQSKILLNSLQVESNVDHQGNKKKLNFDKKKFKEFENKIEYLVIDNFPNNFSLATPPSG